METEFSRLDLEVQEVIRNDGQRICSQAWDCFLRTLPCRPKIDDDITPALPGIKRDYYKTYVRHHCDTVAYSAIKDDSIEKQLETAEWFYAYHLDIEIGYIEDEPDLLQVLNHMLPDPNLWEFDIAVKGIKQLMSDALLWEETQHEPIFHRLNRVLAERVLRKRKQELDRQYANLERRTQQLRKNEYEEVQRIFAYLCDVDKDVSHLPVEVRNDVAVRLHAIHSYERATGQKFMLDSNTRMQH